jgi:magnesium-transporting ATPase (P-type)
MRLFLCGLMVVAIFVFVAFLIAWLFPEGAGWVGVCIAVTCLYAGTFAAWALFGSQTDKKANMIQGEVSRTHPLRDNILYFAVAMALVTLVIAVVIHDTERGVHRSVKNDWTVGLGSAGLALSYAAKAFWTFRRSWRLWAIIAALFVVFGAITLPILSQMEKVPLLLMGPLANVELLLAILLLDWIVPGKSGNRTCGV